MDTFQVWLVCEQKYSAYFILYQTIHGEGDIQFAANLSNFVVWRTILRTVSVLSPSFYVSLCQFASVCVALLSCDGNAGFIDKKCESVFAYTSQFHDPDNKDGETPISSKTFKESINYRSRDLGRLIGTEYGEGFTVERYPAVDSLFDLK